MSKPENIEIERKFLVNFDSQRLPASQHLAQLSERHYVIKQGYLLAAKEKTVRVRIKGDKGYLTIKGASNEKGFSRFEWEKEIALNDAEQLLELCDGCIIHKTRYEVIYRQRTFEVDVFHGVHEGLILAELELEAENAVFETPEWLGEEVTGDQRYYNAWLSQHAFGTTDAELP